MFKDAIISALFGALGPFFNKQATTDPNRLIVKKLTEANLYWAIYIYNAACIALMLTMNTVSVKYKMLCYKNDGSFFGTTVIFCLGYLFSSFFDYLIGESLMPYYRYLGVLMIMSGVLLIRCHPEPLGLTKAGTGQITKESTPVEEGQLLSLKKLKQIEVVLGLEAVNLDPDHQTLPETQAASVTPPPRPDLLKIGSAAYL